MSKLQLPESLSFPFDLTFDKKYYIVVKKSVLAAEVCDGCNGEGYITLVDGGKYHCPKCNGDRLLHKAKSSGYSIETLYLFKVSVDVESCTTYLLAFSGNDYTLRITRGRGNSIDADLIYRCTGVQLCDISKRYPFTDNIYEAQDALKKYEGGQDG